MNAPDPANAQAAAHLIEVTVPASPGGRDDPMIGRDVIGQYRIEKKLGCGGMGAVYLAQQTSVSRPAVIKVLRSQLGGSSEGTARFAVEAKAASSLNHPNIVTIYNYGEMEDGTLFLAMEYLAGETLAQCIERCGRLPADRAVHIAAQIASALGEAHAHGVVHRDLKPSNVMLVERAGEVDVVKVLDFGIAKLDGVGVTSAGYVVGTPRYMSPEQLLGQRLDRRSDIYSTGIVLYEMLAGQTPFSSETPLGWMHQHVDVEPKPPSALAKGAKIPLPIERVVLRALAKAPADRPQSMEMFALELVAALNAPTEPAPPPRWQRALRASARGLVSAVRLLVAVAIALGSRAWKAARRIGLGMWRFVRAIGSGVRRISWAIVSGTWRGVRSIVSRTRRGLRGVVSGARRVLARKRPVSTPAPAKRPVSTPSPAIRAIGSGSRTLASLPVGHRILIALVVVLASAALLVALFPEIRSDFGLGGDDKPAVSKPTKRQHASDHGSVHEHLRDKEP
jgi:predicted Ser/Thr protein kinase